MYLGYFSLLIGRFFPDFQAGLIVVCLARLNKIIDQKLLFTIINHDHRSSLVEVSVYMYNSITAL